MDIHILNRWSSWLLINLCRIIFLIFPIFSIVVVISKSNINVLDDFVAGNGTGIILNEVVVHTHQCTRSEASLNRRCFVLSSSSLFMWWGKSHSSVENTVGKYQAFLIWRKNRRVYSIFFFFSFRSLFQFYYLSFLWVTRWSFTEAWVTARFSRSLLTILAVHNNAMVWIVSSIPLISYSSSHFSKPLETVPIAPTIVGITVTIMFHAFFFHFMVSCKYFLVVSLSSIFFVVRQKDKILEIPIFFFFLINARIRGSVCISNSQRIVSVLFFRRKSGLCIYYLVVWLNLILLHSSKWITFPSQSILILCFFCASLLHLPWVSSFPLYFR